MTYGLAFTGFSGLIYAVVGGVSIVSGTFAKYQARRRGE